MPTEIILVNGERLHIIEPVEHVRAATESLRATKMFQLVDERPVLLNIANIAAAIDLDELPEPEPAEASPTKINAPRRKVAA